MVARKRAGRRPVAPAAGALVSLTGIGLVGVGMWARRETRRALARERILSAVNSTAESAPVTSAGAARCLADFIRENTIEATGGRTYAEVEPYLDADGKPTSDSARAATDERTGRRIENPDHELWIQSTTLQTALMQAYLAFRLAELTVALGTSFTAAGIGLAAAGRARAS